MYPIPVYCIPNGHARSQAKFQLGSGKTDGNMGTQR